MVVTEQGQFLTQREYPRLALVTPKLSEGTLELSASNYDSIRLGIQTSGTPWHVDVWKSKASMPLTRAKKPRAGSPTGSEQRSDSSISRMAISARLMQNMQSTLMITPALQMATRSC